MFGGDAADQDNARGASWAGVGGPSAGTGARVGKINLSGAKDNAMRTSFYSAKELDKEGGAAGETAASSLPSLALSTGGVGNVEVKLLSWMDRVKAQHLKKLRGPALPTQRG
jgi:hypothetical protein